MTKWSENVLWNIKCYRFRRQNCGKDSDESVENEDPTSPPHGRCLISSHNKLSYFVPKILCLSLQNFQNFVISRLKTCPEALTIICKKDVSTFFLWFCIFILILSFLFPIFIFWIFLYHLLAYLYNDFIYDSSCSLSLYNISTLRLSIVFWFFKYMYGNSSSWVYIFSHLI